MHERPAAMGALNPTQVICDLGFKYAVYRLVQIVTKQHIFGRNGAIGLQLEYPMPISLAVIEQRPRCRVDINRVRDGGQPRPAAPRPEASCVAASVLLLR